MLFMYIDPNTGGLLFQILAVLFGILSGIIILFSSKIRMFMSRITRWRRERSTRNEKTDTQE
jgi:hypothetical protein